LADATIGTRARDLIAAFKSDPAHGALLLDFDGTLTPIERDPEVPMLSDAQIDLLHALSLSIGTLAIVSGRAASFLVGRLGFATHPQTRLVAFGRGGLDAIDSTGTITSNESFARWDTTMRELADDAREAAPLAWIEEKGVVLTFHWRRAPETEPVLREVARRAVSRLGLDAREAKQSIEVFPRGVPGKPEVVRMLAEGSRVLAYFGDDTGDLEAYDALDRLGDEARTFRVCVTGVDVPAGMQERADLVLDSSVETFELLTLLADELRA
jgi:trehalose 6-phosphate phosphatase